MQPTVERSAQFQCGHVAGQVRAQRLRQRNIPVPCAPEIPTLICGSRFLWRLPRRFYGWEHGFYLLRLQDRWHMIALRSSPLLGRGGVMAGTGHHPEGHVLRPILDSFFACEDGHHAHMICRTCAEVCPVPGSECIDDC